MLFLRRSSKFLINSKAEMDVMSARNFKVRKLDQAFMNVWLRFIIVLLLSVRLFSTNYSLKILFTSHRQIMKSTSGLRKKIEETIGRQVLEKFCQRIDGTPGPIMIPPIPESKHIDKLPEDVELEGQTLAEKNLQEGYEAEVKVFRRFEELRGDVIVLHQLEYTHEQYCSFIPGHKCNKKNCEKGPEVHPCHQVKGNIDGETDFVVISSTFVAVFEVKGLFLENTDEDDKKFEGCCDSMEKK